MRFVKMVLPAAMLVPAAFLIVGGLIAPTPGFSTKKYSDDNGKKVCTTCHQKMQAPAAMHTDPMLTETGKCFQKAGHKLDGCPTPDKK